MVRYEFTNKAVEDLTNIWNYTLDKWSEQQADRYYNQLIDCFNDIVKNPDLGRNYEGIKNDLFGLKINRHIVFYRKRDKHKIEITRI